MKKKHLTNLFFILSLLGLAYFMGLFDTLLYGYNNNNYPVSSRYTNNSFNTPGYMPNNPYMFNDSLNRYRSTDGIESNEQYSNPNNIGVNGDLFARGRRRNYQSPDMIGSLNIM